jgi:uncharacterized protein
VTLPTSATIDVHVQPRAKKTEIVGMHGDAIKIRLQSPPVDGAANKELMGLLSKRLGVQRTDVELIGGVSSRRKRIRINGLTASDVHRALGVV